MIKKIGILICLATLILSGCYFLPEEEEVFVPELVKPKEAQYVTVAAEKGEIIQEVNCSATFVPEKIEHAFFTTTDRMKKVYVKYGQIVEEGELLAELETHDLELGVKQQTIALEKSKLAYERAQVSGASEYDIQIEKLNVESQQLELENRKRNLERAQLYAPMSGMVVYVEPLSAGQMTNAYQTIVSLASLDAYVLEYTGSNAKEFALGDRVSVAYQKEIYEGEVVMTPTSVPFELMETYKDTIRIKLIEAKAVLNEVNKGDIAKVTKIKEERSDILLVPTRAVKISNGLNYVYVLQDGIRVEKGVEVGIKTNAVIEIISGLEENELVIID